jgi:hypothetical protein
LLGEERWLLIQSKVTNPWEELRRVLGLNAGSESQQIAVWIEEKDRQLVTGYSWSGGFTSMSSSGPALKLFTFETSAGEEAGGNDPLDYFGAGNLSGTLKKRVLGWFQSQSATRLGKGMER